MTNIKIINKLSTVFTITTLVLLSATASAQNHNCCVPSYYSNNYNYVQNNGTTIPPAYNDNYYTNNGYNQNYNYTQPTISATTNNATNVYSNGATLNGYVNVSNNNYNSYNNPGSVNFQYGTSYNNLNTNTSLANVYGSTSASATLSNLSCSTTYYYRIVTPQQIGSTMSFTTSSCVQNYNYNYNNGYNYNTGYNYNNYVYPTSCMYGQKYYSRHRHH